MELHLDELYAYGQIPLGVRGSGAPADVLDLDSKAKRDHFPAAHKPFTVQHVRKQTLRVSRKRTSGRDEDPPPTFAYMCVTKFPGKNAIFAGRSDGTIIAWKPQHEFRSDIKATTVSSVLNPNFKVQGCLSTHGRPPYRVNWL